MELQDSMREGGKVPETVREPGKSGQSKHRVPDAQELVVSPTQHGRSQALKLEVQPASLVS